MRITPTLRITRRGRGPRLKQLLDKKLPRCWLILIRLMHSYCKVRTDLVFFFTLNHFSAEVEKLSSEEQGLDDQISSFLQAE
ncbi:hypothetical protein GLYMA_12G156702v4 [Glycine max]|nr:hypothetical protein GLYMA_12G156702v4 [Glycine max]KAH1143369.1 hypothetical protein GYH30_033873 [Glycine max]